MSGRRDDSLPLDAMIDAAARLVTLGAHAPPGHLGEQREVNEQILWNLVVLGEACKRLSAQTRQRHPEVAWRDVAQTRDRIIHHYDGIDWHIVSRIIELELPELLPRLTSIRDMVRAEFDAETEAPG